MTNKEFVQNHVAFSALKKAGFFPKEMKFNDYDAIVKRFLHFWGEKSIEEYVSGLPEYFGDDKFVSGKFPDKVLPSGELKLGGGFHLSLAERNYDIVCCICECPQTVSVSTSTNQANKKCKGCKRKIQVFVTKEGVEVKERT